ncbi:hypothetical protein [Solicola gregarius]|uniref:Uncharacterized protein n=1 Tax=Solicola gregarius TaxID=2908642 RepID=A0AA46TGH0_9ACTN|nr:hypothetical protein [Solicola gregarius]UYM04876.1 hypothetical protein L0C25_20475 [Solicola gregarius]
MAFAGALAAPLLLGAPAPAAPGAAPDRVTRSTTSDPDDTRGPLDIASVTHRIAVRDRHRVDLTYTVRTYEPFRTADLQRRHRNITLELGTEAEPGASRNITVYARDGWLRADLISNATRKRIARLDVRRVGRRAVRVRGPRRLIGARRYFVVSRYENRSTAPCGMAGNVPITCGDDVPRRGWLRLDRPAWPRPSSTAG